MSDKIFVRDTSDTKTEDRRNSLVITTAGADAESTKTATPDDNSSAPPDGGLRAWLQVLGSFLLLFNGWGFANSFGVFQSTYQDAHLASASAISWIGSIQAFLLLLVGVFTGSLFDKGYYRYLIGVGTFLMVLGTFMTSLSKEYYQALMAQGICTGLGAGLLLVPSLAIVSTYFEKRRAFATGVAACGGSIGGTVYPILFRSLLHKVGFEWTVRVMGFIVLGSLLPCFAILETRTVNLTRRTETEIKVSSSAHKSSSVLETARAMLNPRSYAVFVLSLFFVYCGMYIPTFYLENYAASLPRTISYSYLIPTLNLSSVAGRVFGSLLADRFGALKIMIPSTLVCGTLAASWAGIKSVEALYAFTVLYGYCSGTVASLPPPIIVDLTATSEVPRKHLEDIGMRMGVAFSVGAVGLLIGNPIAGALVKDTGGGDTLTAGRGGYLGAQLFCAVTVTAATFLMIVARYIFMKMP